MHICNPMSQDDLDAVVQHLAAGTRASGEPPRVLDVACGYGELLIRLARQFPTLQGAGVDLSPWMVNGAVREHQNRVPEADLTWQLHDAADLGPIESQPWDAVACLGATWVWHGLNGTIRAIAALARPGGRVAIGDMRTRDGVTSADVPDKYGAVSTLAEQEALFADHGLQIVDRIDTADQSWDAYIARTHACAEAWPTDDYVAVQQEWEADHQRDRNLLTWSVWIADRLG